MKREHVDKLPAIIGCREAAELLGWKRDSVKIVARSGKLPSLGKRTSGCGYEFSAHYVVSILDDIKWLDEAQAIVRRSNRKKNLEQKARREAARTLSGGVKGT